MFGWPWQEGFSLCFFCCCCGQAACSHRAEKKAEGRSKYLAAAAAQAALDPQAPRSWLGAAPIDWTTGGSPSDIEWGADGVCG